MYSYLKILRFRQYQVSQIKESSNNRLVDIGDSFLALLDTLPKQGSEANVEPTPIVEHRTANTFRKIPNASVSGEQPARKSDA